MSLQTGKQMINERSISVDNGEDEISEPGAINKKVLSVFWKRGRLGGALFDCESFELHLLYDIVDVRPDFNNLKSLINFVSPSEVLTYSNSPEVFLDSLRRLLIHSDDSANDTTDPVNLKLLSATRAELNLEACKRRIYNLRLESEPTTGSPEDHELYINSLIDLNLECMVTSLSLLIGYLEKFLPQVLLSHTAWSILSVQYIRIDNIVFVDDDTLRALQVFSPLHHPSAFLRGLGKPREGLSVLGLFGRCRSPDGCRRLREILASPTRDFQLLKARHDAIEFLSLPLSQQVVASLNHSVSRVRNIAGILTRIRQTHATVSNWQTLYCSIYNTILIGRICNSHSSASQLFANIAENVTVEVHEVAHFIDKIVDFEESRKKNKFCVRLGVDNNLDNKRQLFSQVPGVLQKVANLELKDLPKTIQQCSIVFITELGYLLCVPTWLEVDADTSSYYLPDFQVKFVMNKHVYYKTPRCKELDRVLGDLIAQMSSLESDIMVVLTQFIRRRVAAILTAVSLIPDLDCILAMAEVARENNLVRPKLVTESVLEIIEGRHPLQELCVERFVTNDTYCSIEKGKVKLLTGPNASGKSVYLKQVALIAYLAHVGSFVPAEKVTIGPLDHIQSRTQTVESCSMNMSAFYIDLSQMMQCLYNSSPNSLLIIDEFGKGTTEIDGQALLLGALHHFLARKSNCPHLLVSTHFHEGPRMLSRIGCDEKLFTLQRMAYTIKDDDLVFLHKVENGEAGSSYAYVVAKATGFSDEALKRSQELLTSTGECYPDPRLKVTQHTLEEISYMKEFFGLDVEE